MFFVSKYKARYYYEKLARGCEGQKDSLAWCPVAQGSAIVGGREAGGGRCMCWGQQQETRAGCKVCEGGPPASPLRASQDWGLRTLGATGSLAWRVPGKKGGRAETDRVGEGGSTSLSALGNCALFRGCKCFRQQLRMKLVCYWPPKRLSLSTTFPITEKVLSPWTGGRGSET